MVFLQRVSLSRQSKQRLNVTIKQRRITSAAAVHFMINTTVRLLTILSKRALNVIFYNRTAAMQKPISGRYKNRSATGV